MAHVIKLEKGNIKLVLNAANNVVKEKGVLIYPTDTVYGIGGDATEPAVVERIRAMKGRDGQKPFSVIMSDIEMIKDYCEMSAHDEQILRKYLPGPYTFILKIHRPLPATSTLTVGVRIPELDFCNQLSEAVGKPIVSTSANLSGEEPAKTFHQLDKKLLAAADLAIDGGATRYFKPSTVVDLVNKKILRGTVEGSFLNHLF